MIIKYDKNIEKQTFLESGSVLQEITQDSSLNPDQIYELGIINNPRVTLDNQRWAELQNANLIHYLFSEAPVPVTFDYEGTMVNWLKLPDTWPPTIDTIVHLRGQDKSESVQSAKTVLDIFCGTGMAGKHALRRNPNIESIMFSDIEINYINHIIHNMEGENSEVNYVMGNVFEKIGYKYDLIIASAVPATSVAPHVTRAINPIFEGTNSLKKLIYNARDYLNENGTLIVSHSSAGDIKFEEYIKEQGADAKLLHQQEGLFRVEFLRDPMWVDYLVERKGLSQNPDGTYNHTIRVKEVSF